MRGGSGSKSKSRPFSSKTAKTVQLITEPRRPETSGAAEPIRITLHDLFETAVTMKNEKREEPPRQRRVLRISVPSSTTATTKTVVRKQSNHSNHPPPITLVPKTTNNGMQQQRQQQQKSMKDSPAGPVSRINSSTPTIRTTTTTAGNLNNKIRQLRTNPGNNNSNAAIIDGNVRSSSAMLNFGGRPDKLEFQQDGCAVAAANRSSNNTSRMSVRSEPSISSNNNNNNNNNSSSKVTSKQSPYMIFDSSTFHQHQHAHVCNNNAGRRGRDEQLTETYTINPSIFLPNENAPSTMRSPSDKGMVSSRKPTSNNNSNNGNQMTIPPRHQRNQPRKQHQSLYSSADNDSGVLNAKLTNSESPTHAEKFMMAAANSSRVANYPDHHHRQQQQQESHQYTPGEAYSFEPPVALLIKNFPYPEPNPTPNHHAAQQQQGNVAEKKSQQPSSTTDASYVPQENPVYHHTTTNIPSAATITNHQGAAMMNHKALEFHPHGGTNYQYHHPQQQQQQQPNQSFFPNKPISTSFGHSNILQQQPNSLSSYPMALSPNFSQHLDSAGNTTAGTPTASVTASPPSGKSSVTSSAGLSHYHHNQSSYPYPYRGFTEFVPGSGGGHHPQQKQDTDFPFRHIRHKVASTQTDSTPDLPLTTATATTETFYPPEAGRPTRLGPKPSKLPAGLFAFGIKRGDYEKILGNVERSSRQAQESFALDIVDILHPNSLSYLRDLIDSSLRRDFIANLPPEICQKIYQYLGDPESCKHTINLIRWRRNSWTTAPESCIELSQEVSQIIDLNGMLYVKILGHGKRGFIGAIENPSTLTFRSEFGEGGTTYFLRIPSPLSSQPTAIAGEGPVTMIGFEDGQVQGWAWEKQHFLFEFKNPSIGAITSLCGYFPQSLIAAGTEDSTIHIWYICEQTATIPVHIGTYKPAMAFSSESHQFGRVQEMRFINKAGMTLNPDSEHLSSPITVERLFLAATFEGMGMSFLGRKRSFGSLVIWEIDRETGQVIEEIWSKGSLPDPLFGTERVKNSLVVNESDGTFAYLTTEQGYDSYSGGELDTGVVYIHQFDPISAAEIVTPFTSTKLSDDPSTVLRDWELLGVGSDRAVLALWEMYAGDGGGGDGGGVGGDGGIFQMGATSTLYFLEKNNNHNIGRSLTTNDYETDWEVVRELSIWDDDDDDDDDGQQTAAEMGQHRVVSKFLLGDSDWLSGWDGLSDTGGSMIFAAAHWDHMEANWKLRSYHWSHKS